MSRSIVYKAEVSKEMGNSGNMWQYIITCFLVRLIV
jgi:hypothetical protein